MSSNQQVTKSREAGIAQHKFLSICMYCFQNINWSSKAFKPLQKHRSQISQNKYKTYVTEAIYNDTRMGNTPQTHHANVQTWFDRVV
jgi:hypothetical protein